MSLLRIDVLRQLFARVPAIHRRVRAALAPLDLTVIPFLRV